MLPYVPCFEGETRGKSRKSRERKTEQEEEASCCGGVVNDWRAG